MAKRGTVKALSVEHENFIAYLFGGKRSRSSGAAPGDPGDVRADPWLVECKMTGNPECGQQEIEARQRTSRRSPKRRLRRESIRWWRYAGMTRFSLSNNEGWCDLVVMRAQWTQHTMAIKLGKNFDKSKVDQEPRTRLQADPAHRPLLADVGRTRLHL
jgi:hypothetical protein